MMSVNLENCFGICTDKITTGKMKGFDTKQQNSEILFDNCFIYLFFTLGKKTKYKKRQIM